MADRALKGGRCQWPRCGQLVRQHLLPFDLDRGSLGAVGQGGKGRHRNALELAFARQGAAQQRAVRLHVLPAEQVHHVVEIARALALGQCAHLLGEDLFERIAEDVDALAWDVGVRVMDGPLNRAQHENFVGGQVQLYAGRVALLAKGATAADAALP